MFGRIDHEDDSVERAAVVRPSLPRLIVSPQIVRIEPNISYGYFCLVGVERGVCLSESVALEHVEHCRLASVVQSQEHNVGALLEEPEPFHRSTEEVNDEHF